MSGYAKRCTFYHAVYLLVSCKSLSIEQTLKTRWETNQFPLQSKVRLSSIPLIHIVFHYDCMIYSDILVVSMKYCFLYCAKSDFFR